MATRALFSSYLKQQSGSCCVERLTHNISRSVMGVHVFQLRDIHGRTERLMTIDIFRYKSFMSLKGFFFNSATAVNCPLWSDGIVIPGRVDNHVCVGSVVWPSTEFTHNRRSSFEVECYTLLSSLDAFHAALDH